MGLSYFQKTRGASDLTEQKFCCDKFKEMFNQDRVTHDTDDYPSKPDPEHFYLKLFDVAYPECGAILDYQMINFCPWCGKKLI